MMKRLKYQHCSTEKIVRSAATAIKTYSDDSSLHSLLAPSRSTFLHFQTKSGWTNSLMLSMKKGVMKDMSFSLNAANGHFFFGPV